MRHFVSSFFNNHHGVDISEPDLTVISKAHARQLQGHTYVVDFEAEQERPTFQQLSPDLFNYWTEQEARILDLVKKPITSCHKGRNLRSLHVSTPKGMGLVGITKKK